MTDARDAARLNAVLEALSFERRLRDARTFEDLFLRFQRRVACETLTRPAGDPHAFDAERFFAEWVEEETGLAGEERARAFEWLAGNCGFDVTAVTGTCRRPWGAGGFSSKVSGAAFHRALVATVQGRSVVADIGFPLPVLLPIDPPACGIPTALGSLSLEVGPAGPGPGEFRVTCDGRGEVAELLRLFPPPSEPALLREELSRRIPVAQTRPETPRRPFALRLLDDRVLFWSAGCMTILDAWSRLEYSLPASERAALEKLFALELGGVALPDETHQTPPAPATLRVFHESPVSADEARGRVARDAPALSLVAGRETWVEESGAGSRITIEASLAPSLPPEGPTEAVRKRLVFHLMSELFELSRG
jgi:hypothetical protein